MFLLIPRTALRTIPFNYFYFCSRWVSSVTFLRLLAVMYVLFLFIRVLYHIVYFELATFTFREGENEQNGEKIRGKSSDFRFNEGNCLEMTFGMNVRRCFERDGRGFLIWQLSNFVLDVINQCTGNRIENLLQESKCCPYEPELQNISTYLDYSNLPVDSCQNCRIFYISSSSQLHKLKKKLPGKWILQD